MLNRKEEKEMNKKQYTQFDLMNAIMKALVFGSQLELDINNPSEEPPREFQEAFNIICEIMFEEKRRENSIEEEIKSLMGNIEDKGFNMN